MKRISKSAFLIAMLSAFPLMAQSSGPIPPRSSSDHLSRVFTGEMFSGYYDGVGVHFSGTFANFAQGFPFQIRFGIGYAWVPTGDAVRARRVFIDQATGGSPRSSGKNWDARLDLMYPVKLFSLDRSRVFGGLRLSSYTAYFEYIGGNETFDVNSDPWGLGGGVETMFALSPKVDLIVSAGADYYFRSLLTGHDTYYRPNGDNLNEKENFTYKDADACIAQPDFQTRLMLGVGYRF